MSRRADVRFLMYVTGFAAVILQVSHATVLLLMYVTEPRSALHKQDQTDAC